MNERRTAISRRSDNCHTVRLNCRYSTKFSHAAGAVGVRGESCPLCHIRIIEAMSNARQPWTTWALTSRSRVENLRWRAGLGGVRNRPSDAPRHTLSVSTQRCGENGGNERLSGYQRFVFQIFSASRSGLATVWTGRSVAGPSEATWRGGGRRECLRPIAFGIKSPSHETPRVTVSEFVIRTVRRLPSCAGCSKPPSYVEFPRVPVPTLIARAVAPAARCISLSLRTGSPP